MNEINYGMFAIGLVLPIVAIGLAILYVSRGGRAYLNEAIAEFCKYAKFPKFSGYKKHHIVAREDGPLLVIIGIAGEVLVIDIENIEKSGYVTYPIDHGPIRVDVGNNLYCKTGVDLYGRILIDELK